MLNPLLETYLGITVADRSLTGGGSIRRTQEWHDVSCAHLTQETFVFDGMQPSEDIPFLDFSVKWVGASVRHPARIQPGQSERQLKKSGRLSRKIGKFSQVAQPLDSIKQVQALRTHFVPCDTSLKF